MEPLLGPTLFEMELPFDPAFHFFCKTEWLDGNFDTQLNKQMS
jgi:hypothetical protein